MANTTPLVELTNVSKRYGEAPEGGSPPILSDVSLQLLQGESLAITGPSGSGKSTLLNIMGTLDRPTSGTVRLEERDVSQLNDDQVAHLRNRLIGFVFQLHHLLPQCTVLENVLVPTLANSGELSTEDPKARALRLLDRVGLTERLTYFPGQLSGGERQRVAVVRALINTPKLVLADEPTGSLDRTAAGNLTQLLVELNREEDVALVVVTHSQEVAARMSRRRTIVNGSLVDG
ncbi:MAG: ABC transporter ATP-binding protein [Armatimonadetes bacterium]|nr:ABC transporter ATP-binding protein [Armatimonadota bacterium]